MIGTVSLPSLYFSYLLQTSLLALMSQNIGIDYLHGDHSELGFFPPL